MGYRIKEGFLKVGAKAVCLRPASVASVQSTIPPASEKPGQTMGSHQSLAPTHTCISSRSQSCTTLKKPFSEQAVIH